MVKVGSLLKIDKMEEKRGEKVSRSPFHALALRQTATPLVAAQVMPITRINNFFNIRANSTLFANLYKGRALSCLFHFSPSFLF